MYSSKLLEMIAIDREEMEKILDAIDRVLKRLEDAPEPNVDLVVALGAYVHSLYMGVENILKQIAIEGGHTIPKTEQWHKTLLDLFSPSSPSELPHVLDAALRSQIDEMRAFRHVFRIRYALQMQLPKVEPVASRSRKTVERFFVRVFNPTYPTVD